MSYRVILAAVLASPATLAAQAADMPSDWTWRLDRPQQLTEGQNVAAGEWRYTKMPPGWHVTTSDQGVSLFPKDKVISGRWGIEVELFLFPKPSDAPLGIILEAKDAEPAGSRQLRFLMRRDGTAALVARHGGTDTTLVTWTADTAVKAHEGGVEKYVLRVVHEGGALTFALNGRQMFKVPTGGEDHPSIPGLRIGPGLNVHVSRYDLITPLAPVRQ